MKLDRLSPESTGAAGVARCFAFQIKQRRGIVSVQPLSPVFGDIVDAKSSSASLGVNPSTSAALPAPECARVGQYFRVLSLAAT